jgi:MoaA/NifB/PqqE/SkfB family radical SAM enzyme
MDERINRIKKWMEGKKPGPYSVEFFTDVGCNQFCKFCESGTKKVKNLNFKAAFKILDEAKQLDVRVVRIIGLGEPFLKKDLMLKLMEKVKEYNMEGYIVTNGSLLDEKNIKKIVEMGWEELRFSIHGPDAATHDYLVGVSGSFDKVLENIKFFHKWKNRLKKEKPRIRLNFVLNKKNYKKIEKMVSLCEKYNCDFVLLPLDTGTDNAAFKKLVLNKNERKKFQEDMKNIKKRFKDLSIELFLPYARNEILIDKTLKTEDKLKENFDSISYKEEKPNLFNFIKTKIKKESIIDKYSNAMCFEPWLNITIRDYEKFGVCCPAVNVPKGIKNKRKYKTLKDIWYGEYYEYMRKASLERDFQEYCSFCCSTETKSIAELLKKFYKSKND